MLDLSGGPPALKDSQSLLQEASRTRLIPSRYRGAGVCATGPAVPDDPQPSAPSPHSLKALQDLAALLGLKNLCHHESLVLSHTLFLRGIRWRWDPVLILGSATRP